MLNNFQHHQCSRESPFLSYRVHSETDTQTERQTERQRQYAVLAVYHKREPEDKIYLSFIKYDKDFCDKMTNTLIEFYTCFTDTHLE